MLANDWAFTSVVSALRSELRAAVTSGVDRSCMSFRACWIWIRMPSIACVNTRTSGRSDVLRVVKVLSAAE